MQPLMQYDMTITDYWVEKCKVKGLRGQLLTNLQMLLSGLDMKEIWYFDK